MKNFTLFAFLTILSFASCASELFVKVNSNETFYAMLGVQTHYNNSNVFKFCDISSGMVELKIYKNNTSNLFYSGSINVEFNQRVVCEIDSYGNLQVIQRIALSYLNWYTVTTQGGSGGYVDNTNYGNSNNNTGFQEFIKMLKQESFDSNKLDQAKKYASKTMLSASQIAEIAQQFSYDSNRLDWAKYAYTYCYDKQNYFMLKSTFSYMTNYSELEKYIENK